MMTLESARRVLAFGAHPDDLEVGAGGLLARLSAAGAEVTMAIASVPSRFEQRRDEARQAARILSARLVFLFDDDRRLESVAMHELVARFDEIVARIDPDLVVTHGERDHHLDHLLVHRATVSALRRRRSSTLTYDTTPYLDPRAACFVDISAHIDAKLASLRAHASQSLDVEARRDLARTVGHLRGCDYAERFDVLRLCL